MTSERPQTDLHCVKQMLPNSSPLVRIHVHPLDTNKDLLIIPEYGMMEYPNNILKGGLYEILQQAAPTLLWS